MSTQVNPIPDGYSTVTPHLVVHDAARAVEFYQRAFAAQELFRLAAPTGPIIHSEVRIGNSIVMLVDELPGSKSRSPEALGATTVTLHLYVDDCDAWFRRAVDAGAAPKLPPTDMFWGDRYALVRDPFGHQWALGTRREDLSPQEVGRRAQRYFQQLAQQANSKSPDPGKEP